MSDIKQKCSDFISDSINQLKSTKNIQFDGVLPVINPETPPDPAMGDIGFPMFQFSKIFKMAPLMIAKEVVAIINEKCDAKSVGEFLAVGPYVNVKLQKSSVTKGIIDRIFSEKDDFGKKDAEGKSPLENQRVMIEFSSPNTNKPLHLGHLRNDALGESASRIMKAAGAEVYKVNIINNRGVHICKSMLAYIKNHSGHPEYVTADGISPDFKFTLKDTPESLGIKSDRFVGDCYVEFDKMKKADPAMETAAQNLLVEWEKNNAEVRKLWQQMNDWTISGVSETYKRTDVSFDKLYFESETYLKGKDEILKGLEKGIFYKAEDGSVRVDVSDVVGKNKDGEDQQKVLLRKDGTSVYITQDIGTAINRHQDWAFNQLVYVVGSEQQYHFKVLFYILKKLGYEWTNQLYHLSYGMVNLPEGRMKSREGTVVDADDLINQLRDGALEEISSKGRESVVVDPKAVAEKIALGALHYYLLQATPSKDMLFNPKESLSFNGNTGPYLQYMGARISSILRKASESGISVSNDVDYALLESEAEWQLAKTLGEYPEIVKKAALNLDPSEIATYLYDVSKAFSTFYHDCPILSSENDDLKKARLALAYAALQVLKNGMNLVLIPFLEIM